MRLAIILLVALLCFLQYRLWIGNGSLTEVHHLKTTIQLLEDENNQLRERNSSLAAEVLDLREGKQAIEERARSEMGMIKEGETFYQIIDKEDLPQVQANAVIEEE